MLSAAAVSAIAIAALATPATAAETATGKATFLGTKGEDVGTAELKGTPGGVFITIEVKGLPAGQWVAFHVHETGSCDFHTGHDSAGGHFNPTKAEHGYDAAKGPHAGDMPNQYVAADGVLRAQVFNSAVKLDKGDAGIVGRALMIHAGKDDYKTQPTGAAGKRLACAVIE
jgi:Cu-Zn family superoxide dismutase